MRRALGTAVATVAAALALGAPAAQADDASAFASYSTPRPELTAAFDAYKDAVKAWEDKGWKLSDEQARAIADADAAINNALTVVEQDLAAQQASTKKGAAAQKLSLREINLLQLANGYEAKTFQAVIDGQARAADKYLTKCQRAFKRYAKAVRAAKRAWKKAGFKPPKYGVGG